MEFLIYGNMRPRVFHHASTTRSSVLLAYVETTGLFFSTLVSKYLHRDVVRTCTWMCSGKKPRLTLSFCTYSGGKVEM